MARTIDTIHTEILSNIASNPVLGTLNSSSATAVFKLFAYIVAVAVWALEKLFDLFTADVNETIDAMKPHSVRWYAIMAKNFQYGYNLPLDSDKYNNIGLTDEQVAAAKIVTYAAVVEQERGVRIKIAKTVGADLAPLDPAEKTSFAAYMALVKDAGVRLNITTNVADNLYLALRIIYNPLVINATGARIDGADANPVKTAIKAHLKNLPFNGVFSIQKLVDAIQAVEGVNDLAIDAIQSKYGLLPYTTVNVSTIPDAGYLRIADANLLINFIPG